jgi:hypothetical protein
MQQVQVMLETIAVVYTVHICTDKHTVEQNSYIEKNGYIKRFKQVRWHIFKVY